MKLTKQSAIEILDLLDEVDTEDNLLSVIGGISKLFAISEFMEDLKPADEEGIQEVEVKDEHYNLFVPKLIEWKNNNLVEN